MLSGCAQNNSSQQSTTTETASVDSVTNETQISDSDTTAKTTSDSVALTGITYTAKTEVESSYLQLEEENLDTSTDGATLIQLTNDDVTITKAGSYLLEGTLNGGQISVDVGDDELVRLILNGVTITNPDGPAIEVVNAKKVIITLVNNTTNTLSDSKNYILSDADGGEPNATIFSHDDLTLNGEGTLIVNALYNDGIKSKDKLIIVEGTYQINAVGDAIVGKDRLIILDGQYTIDAQGSGIKASNSDEEEKGIIAIVKGTYQITTGEDGIHSNNLLYILGGTYTINAGDDGIHAEFDLTIYGGDIQIQKSYEGIEGSTITVNDGDITIVSSDDGVNVAGGNDQTDGGMMQPGGNAMNTSSSIHVLTINGGTLNVNVLGDGLDSNGAIIMNGGTVYVSGPTEMFNGALDYDASFNITAGVLVAAGSSGMAEAPSESSTQNTMMMMYTSTQAAGTEVTLKDSSGNVIIKYAPSNAFQTIAISAPQLLMDQEYTLTTGSTMQVNFTPTSTITWLNETGVTSAQTQMGGFGGGGAGGGFPGKEGGARGDQGMPNDGTRPEMPTDGTRPDMPADGAFPPDATQDNTYITQPNN